MAPSQKEIGSMFDSIAHRYDFLNHLLSFGFDITWRRAAVRSMNIAPSSVILDLATGTCDLALEAAWYTPKKIIGTDISMNMLQLGRRKISGRSCDGTIELAASTAEQLAFRDNRFDGAMAAFGVRNFADLDAGLRQILRVLKPGGRLVVLEFSKPRLFPFKQLYFFYFKMILPIAGWIISGDRSAYSYLPNSVLSFPEGDDFTERLRQAGFTGATYRRLTLGVVTLYTAVK